MKIYQSKTFSVFPFQFFNVQKKINFINWHIISYIKLFNFLKLSPQYLYRNIILNPQTRVLGEATLSFATWKIASLKQSKQSLLTKPFSFWMVLINWKFNKNITCFWISIMEHCFLVIKVNSSVFTCKLQTYSMDVFLCSACNPAYFSVLSCAKKKKYVIAHLFMEKYRLIYSVHGVSFKFLNLIYKWLGQLFGKGISLGYRHNCVRMSGLKKNVGDFVPNRKT